MANLTLDSVMVINGKKHNVSELVETLIYLKSEDILDFFQNIGLNIPRQRRISVFKHVLFIPVMKTRAERASQADELGYHLSWFRKYTEFQLENLLVYYNDEELYVKYLKALWVMLLDYMMERKVSDDDVLAIIQKSRRVKKQIPEDMKKYNWDLREIFYDKEGEIDGLEPETFRPVLYKSSTLPEIRELGLKYDVKVPRRLRKKELIEIMLRELEKRGDLTPSVEQELRTKNIMLLERYAIDNQIKVSIELKKEEIIEYILANAKETKANYFLPGSSTLYAIEIEQLKVQDEFEEEILRYEEENLAKDIEKAKPRYIEVVKEEVEEKVEEEVVEEEPVVEEKEEVEKPVVVQIQEQPKVVQPEPVKEKEVVVIEKIVEVEKKVEPTIQVREEDEDRPVRVTRNQNRVIIEKAIAVDDEPYVEIRFVRDPYKLPTPSLEEEKCECKCDCSEPHVEPNVPELFPETRVQVPVVPPVAPVEEDKELEKMYDEEILLNSASFSSSKKTAAKDISRLINAKIRPAYITDKKPAYTSKNTTTVVQQSKSSSGGGLFLLGLLLIVELVVLALILYYIISL